MMQKINTILHLTWGSASQELKDEVTQKLLSIQELHDLSDETLVCLLDTEMHRANIIHWD